MEIFDVHAATAEAFRRFEDEGPHTFLPGGGLNTEAIKRCSLAELESWRDREIALVQHSMSVIVHLRGLTGDQSTESSARLEHHLDKEAQSRSRFLGYLLDAIHMVKEDAVIRGIHEQASKRRKNEK